MAYYDENGNEVEGVLSQEEVDKKLEDSKIAIQAEHAKANDAAAETTRLEAEKAEAAKAVEDAKAAGDKTGDTGDKEENMAALRKKLDETTAALEAQTTSNDERWNKATTETLDSTITSIAGEDKELADKVRHHYETTLSGVKAETPAEVREKVANALKLSAKPGTVINPLDVAISGGGGPGYVAPRGDGTKVEVTPEQKKFGAKLGVTDADYKKYGDDPRLTAKK